MKSKAKGKSSKKGPAKEIVISDKEATRMVKNGAKGKASSTKKRKGSY